MQIAPACVEAIVNLGVTFNRLNQPDEAIRAFQRALAKNPQLFAAHLNLGITYFRTARFDLAKESLRNALKVNPEHLQARQLLALTLIGTEDFKEAAIELEETSQSHATRLRHLRRARRSLFTTETIPCCRRLIRKSDTTRSEGREDTSPAGRGSR